MNDMTLPSLWRADTQQQAFRAIMTAFAHPGEVVDLARVAAEEDTVLLVLATLLDGEVSLADHAGRIAAHDRVRLEATGAPPEQARFVLADAGSVADFEPGLGTVESPELGATLLLQVESLGRGGMHLGLHGPGVDGRRQVSVAGLHASWLQRRADWNAGFPLGVDMLLIGDGCIVALPRSTQIDFEGGGR